MTPETPPILSSKDSTWQQVDGAGSQRLQQGLWKRRSARHVSSWSGAEHLRSGCREQIWGWVRTQGGIFRCERRRTGLGWGEQEAQNQQSVVIQKREKGQERKRNDGRIWFFLIYAFPANSGEQKTKGKRCSEHQQGGYTLLLSRRCQSSHQGGPTVVKERKKQMDPSGWAKRRIRNLLLRDG